jgi:hypothetical protein
MATLTFIQDSDDKTARFRRWVGPYTGPASYVANGDSLLPEEVRMGTIWTIHGLVATNGTTIIVGVWRPLLQTIQWFDMTGTEIVAGVDLSAYSCIIEVVGR